MHSSVLWVSLGCANLWLHGYACLHSTIMCHQPRHCYPCVLLLLGGNSPASPQENRLQPSGLNEFWLAQATKLTAMASNKSWVLITGANRATGLGYITAKMLVNDGEAVIIGARSQAAGA